MNRAARRAAESTARRTHTDVHCPECGQRATPKAPDGWGGLVETWFAWPCLFCGARVCNSAIPGGAFPCYVRHTAESHPNAAGAAS